MSILRVAAGVLFGIVFWVFFRNVHTYDKSEAAYHHLIRAPAWVLWFFGRPRPDKNLELSGMIGQIGSLIMIVIFLPMGLLRLKERQQVMLYCGVFCTTLFLAFIVQLAIRIVHLFKGRKGDFSGS